ncbi:MAG: hypothetical protein QM772_15610 [Ottowia sp.]|uniref:hypothetical protein n=1 Tax=Ottowia sp. TaxID=1898956 RepID=UPI0039E4C76A
MPRLAVGPALQPLVRQARALGPALLAGAGDPHDEWLAMVWGPRFDRTHALALWTRLLRERPADAVPLLSGLLQMADAFDALGRPVQQRLRRLILRHRALGTGPAVSAALPE